MNNLYIALFLSLIGKRRFVICTDNQEYVASTFTEQVLKQACNIDQDDISEIDLLEYRDTNGFIRNMVYYSESKEKYVFKKVIIWKNMEKLDDEYQRRILNLLNEIDQYDTHISTIINEPLQIEGLAIHKPTLFTIIPILEYDRNPPKLYQFLKEKFWFSSNYNFNLRKQNDSGAEIKKLLYSGSLEDQVVYFRNISEKVYISSEIVSYIYSLVIQMRNHRLCSLSPNHTRMPTMVIESMKQLTATIIAWQFHDTERLYATPEFVKISVRRISYWLIDWEYGLYAAAEEREDAIIQKQLEINTLSADWYGSDWKYVQKYLLAKRCIRDESSPTGFTNAIVEDAMTTVRPPI